MDFSTAFGLMFLFYAAFTVVGFLSVRFGNVRAAQLAVLCWNSRIDKLNKPPFTALVQALADGHYRRTILWTVLPNAGMALLLFILGVLLIAPFMAGFAGISVGYLFSVADRGTWLPNLPARVVEYGGFAAAGGTGLLVGAEWIFGRAGLEQALVTLTPELHRGLVLTLVLLVLGGLLDAALARRGIPGIPPLESIRGKKYLR